MEYTSKLENILENSYLRPLSVSVKITKIKVKDLKEEKLVISSFKIFFVCNSFRLL